MSKDLSFLKETYTREEVIRMLYHFGSFYRGQIFDKHYFPAFNLFEKPVLAAGCPTTRRDTSLTGKLKGAALTALDSTITDKEQLEAAKSLLKQVMQNHCYSIDDIISDQIEDIMGDKKNCGRYGDTADLEDILLTKEALKARAEKYIPTAG